MTRSLRVLRVTEKYTIITNILNVVAHLQLQVCKSNQDFFKHPTEKIIIITFRTTPNPFQHEVCQTIKNQIIS